MAERQRYVDRLVWRFRQFHGVELTGRPVPRVFLDLVADGLEKGTKGQKRRTLTLLMEYLATTFHLVRIIKIRDRMNVRRKKRKQQR